MLNSRSCGRWCRLAIRTKERAFNRLASRPATTPASTPASISAMTSAEMNASLRQVTQISDAWLATIAHIVRGWGGLIVSSCHVLVTILVLVTLRCRRRRERRRVRRDFVQHQAYRGRRRLIPLSDGSVTDVTDLSQELNDSVFVV